MARKVYLDITVEIDPEGNITPLSFLWPDDGMRYEIDRVLDVRRAAPNKVGADTAPHIRYICRIMQQIRFLFFEPERNRWFIEALK